MDKRKLPKTEEHKLKLSLSQKGIPRNYALGNKNVLGNKFWLGKKHSLESIEKIREAGIGRTPWNKGLKDIYSIEQRKKMSHHKLKGRTFEEIYGKEEAIRQKQMRREKLLGHHVNEKTRLAVKKNRTNQIFPKKDSKIELKIQNFLRQLGIEFYTHHYIKNIEHAYQCDILIPSMNAVIECDGNYWHAYPTGRDIDHVRTKELIEKGFKVLRLWEYEINEMSINAFKDSLEKLK